MHLLPGCVGHLQQQRQMQIEGGGTFGLDDSILDHAVDHDIGFMLCWKSERETRRVFVWHSVLTGEQVWQGERV